MALEGMDVGQVQGLARQVEQLEQALSQVAALTAALAGQLAYHWQGPASAMFQQDWDSRYRPALGVAARALSDLHGHLITNIQQQQGASAAAGGGGSSLGSQIFDEAAGIHRFEPVTWPVEEGMKKLGENKWVTGRYTKSWDEIRDTWKEVTGNPDSRLLDFKSWKVVQWGHDYLPAAADVAEKVAVIIGIPFAAVDVYHAVQDFSQSDVNAGFDESAKGLKDFRVTYPFGVALAYVNDTSERIQQVDWTREGILPGFVDLSNKMSNDYWKILLP